MFKRKQYYGAGPIIDAQQKAGVLPTQVGANTGVGSLLGQMASSFVNSQAGKDIVQGFSVAAGGPTNEQVDTFGYKVSENKKAREKGMDEPFPTPASDLTGIGGEGQTGPTAEQRWAERTRQPTQSVAMALQRMSSGVGAHPGGAGRGKGAGGSLGQESRQAMKRKRLSKRIANRKAKGKDQIQLSSDAPKVRDDQDYAEGGRVGYAVGGFASRLVRKLMKKFDKDPEVKSAVQKIKNDIESIDSEISGMGDAAKLDAEEQFAMMRDDSDYPYRGGTVQGDNIHDQDVQEIINLTNDRQDLTNALQEIEIYGTAPEFDETGFPILKERDVPFAEGGRVDYKEGKMVETNTWAKTPIEKRKMYQEGGNMDSQMADMMEGPTHTMPDGTVMPGATHGEYEQGLAEGQAEDMAQEGMVPDEQMEEDFVAYVVESTLEPEDTMYLEEALAADPRLSEIFDQVIETASEFSGSGPVEGPGSEVSDSIPARLSDGEFVITSKATEEIGPDTLQGMMEQAEMDADVRREAAEGGYMINEDVEVDDPIQPRIDPTEREMRKLQLASNPRSQYRTVYG